MRLTVLMPAQRHGSKLAGAALAAGLLLAAAVAAQPAPSPSADPGTGYTFVDLNPSGFSSSRAESVDNGLVVGYIAGSAAETGTHAAAWRTDGGAGSVVDLHRGGAGMTASQAYDVRGGRISGYGVGPNYPRSGSIIVWDAVGADARRLEPTATNIPSNGWGITGNVVAGERASDGVVSRASIWDATTGAFTDLNGVLNNGPFGGSAAYDIDGNVAVGQGAIQGPNGFASHAVAWDLQTGGFKDLHPAGYNHSWAMDVSGTHAVGYGEAPATGTNDRALLWNLATGAVTELHKSEFVFSNANSVSEAAGLAVGYANVGNAGHAIAWDLQTAVYFDLHTLVPAGYTQSQATSIDALGNIVGSVIAADGSIHAALWRAGGATTPPNSAALLSLTLNPASVNGGATSTGTATLTAAAPASGAAVSLSSSNPTVAQVPTSVTVPAGATTATFTVTTKPVGAATSVTIAGAYAGVTRSAVLSVQTSADAVRILQAVYDQRKRELFVQATSTNARATLQTYVTSSGTLIGALKGDGKGNYSATFQKIANPANITVRSDKGGSATKAVTIR